MAATLTVLMYNDQFLMWYKYYKVLMIMSVQKVLKMSDFSHNYPPLKYNLFQLVYISFLTCSPLFPAARKFLTTHNNKTQYVT